MPLHPEVLSAPVRFAPVEIDHSWFIEYCTDIPGIGNASLTVYPDTNEWHINLCHVNGKERHGIGSHVLQGFVKNIGPGIPVTGGIFHDETIDRIIPYFNQLSTKPGKLLIVKPTELVKFPIIRFLQAGGIQIVSLFVEYYPDWIWKVPSSCLFNGCTMNVEYDFPVILKPKH